MKTTPRDSRAALTFSRLPEREGGMPGAASNLRIVAQPTPEILASSSVLISSKARADRICAEDIIDHRLLVI